MAEDKNDSGNLSPRMAFGLAESWRVMLLLMLVWIPVNFLLPCACVLREDDPRPYVVLLVAGFWVYHLVCCGRKRRFFRRGFCTGFVFLIFAAIMTPM